MEPSTPEHADTAPEKVGVGEVGEEVAAPRRSLSAWNVLSAGIALSWVAGASWLASEQREGMLRYDALDAGLRAFTITAVVSFVLAGVVGVRNWKRGGNGAQGGLGVASSIAVALIVIAGTLVGLSTVLSQSGSTLSEELVDLLSLGGLTAAVAGLAALLITALQVVMGRRGRAEAAHPRLRHGLHAATTCVLGLGAVGLVGFDLAPQPESTPLVRNAEVQALQLAQERAESDVNRAVTDDPQYVSVFRDGQLVYRFAHGEEFGQLFGEGEVSAEYLVQARRGLLAGSAGPSDEELLREYWRAELGGGIVPADLRGRPGTVIGKSISTEGVWTGLFLEEVPFDLDYLNLLDYLAATGENVTAQKGAGDTQTISGTVDGEKLIAYLQDQEVANLTYAGGEFDAFARQRWVREQAREKLAAYGERLAGVQWRILVEDGEVVAYALHHPGSYVTVLEVGPPGEAFPAVGYAEFVRVEPRRESAALARTLG